jgi:hypothetical protein
MPNGYGTVTFPQVVLQPGIPCDGGGGAATAGCSSAAMEISVTSTIISISLQLPVAFVFYWQP